MNSNNNTNNTKNKIYIVSNSENNPILKYPGINNINRNDYPIIPCSFKKRNINAKK